MSEDLTKVIAEDVSELAPEPPPHGPVVWAKTNLFSSWGSSVLTILAGLIAVVGARGMIGYVFDAARRWDAITFNMRLLMTQAYPALETNNQYHRVWISVGIILFLVGASMAVWLAASRIDLRSLGRAFKGIGGTILIATLLAATIPGVVFGSGTSSLKPFHIVISLIIGGAFVGGGYLLTGRPDAKDTTVPLVSLLGGVIALAVALLWVIRLPVPGRVDGEQTVVWDGIASSTLVPWTLVVIVGFLGFFAALALRRAVGEDSTLRRTVISLWVISYPVIVLVILRDPEINYDRLWRVWDSVEYNQAPAEGWLSIGLLNYIGWFPVALVFLAVGLALLWWLTDKSRGEEGTIIAGLILIAALLSWTIPMSFQIRALLLILAMMGLGAKTFGGEGSARIRYLMIYAIEIIVFTYLVVLVSSESSVEVPGVSFMGGFMLTFILAVTSISLSFPLGVLLALGRTSTMPLFRLVSTAYIELVRGVPLITWLLVGAVMLPVFLPEGVEIQGIIRAMFAITFFSAAYLAENVRGGLQSIPKGQYEAAKALGMSTVQMTVFITLPQALRAVIPAIVGQVIALFKDTSLVTIIGIFDFLHIARAVIPAQSQPFNFFGTIRETLLFAAILYWVFTFAFSRASLRLEKKLGLGER